MELCCAHTTTQPPDQQQAHVVRPGGGIQRPQRRGQVEEELVRLRKLHNITTTQTLTHSRPAQTHTTM